MTDRTRQIAPATDISAWVTAVNVAALIAFLLSPKAPDYPLAGLSIVAFLFAPAVFPACRLNGQTPLCPSNVAQGFFWIQMVLVTVLIGYWGFQPGTLPHIPSQAALNSGILIQFVAYLSYCTAFQWTSRNRGRRSPLNSPGAAALEAQRLDAWSRRLILPYAVLGLVGFYLFYGGIQGFIEYFTTPSARLLMLEKEPTLAGAASTFLKYFLGVSIVLAWSSWIRHRDPSRNGSRCVAGTLAALGLVLLANLSYNRGTMLGPALALAASYSLHVVRIPMKGVVLAGALALAAALAFGAYRASGEIESRGTSAKSDRSWSETTVEFVQIYASAPQMAGVMIDQLERDGKFYSGSTLIPSLLYPVPVLGKPWRTSSGVHVFNEVIYGDPDVVDQVVPYGAELYMNLHFPGVAIGYALLGGLVSWFHAKFLSASTAIESYAWMMFSLWTVFPGSIPVASQLYIYAFWPIYIYMALKALAQSEPRHRVTWMTDVTSTHPGWGRST